MLGRELLRPYCGHRVWIEGMVQKFSAFYDATRGEHISTVCLSGPMIDDMTVADYCWVKWADEIRRCGALPGQIVRAEYRVSSYLRKSGYRSLPRFRDFCLVKPRSVACLDYPTEILVD